MPARKGLGCSLLFLALALSCPASAQVDPGQAGLVSALLGDTPMLRDLQELTDRMGGRQTGSKANEAAVEWALKRFHDAGVEARKEGFQMPGRWIERAARVTIKGEERFSPRVVSLPFSTATPAAGLEAPLLDAGHGEEEDFARLGKSVQGAWLLVETDPLLDLDGLFEEYTRSSIIESRAFAARAAGLVYQSSRPNDLLARHLASLVYDNRHPLLMMERDGASRVLRLLRAGERLKMEAHIDIESGGPFESHNVIGEIKGTIHPEEIVVVGAHLDSWDLGDGALDNGANVAMLIDMARQVQRLGLRPARTLRFILWNGEEQGLLGSWGYTMTHGDEMERHVMASSYDIGTGRITGFFTGGRPEIADATSKALEAIGGLGPFTQLDVPIVGTDNFDFMLQGVANLVANQESANYGPNYHARSDTFDKVDAYQLRINAAIAATVTWWYANADVTWRRQSRAEVERLVSTTDLADQMKTFHLWQDWTEGKRGRQP